MLERIDEGIGVRRASLPKAAEADPKPAGR
jgi:hypothetical protein